MPPLSLQGVCDELHNAQHLLSELGLYRSATWAGELLEDIASEADESGYRKTLLEHSSSNAPTTAFDPDVHFCYGRNLFEEMVCDVNRGTLNVKACLIGV